MTIPRIAAGTTTSIGVFTGIPTQQSCGVTSKRTGAAATIHGHCSGRLESHAGIVSGSIGAKVRSHHGSAVAAAITGAVRISARLAATIANHGASAQAMVAASASPRGTLCGLNDATVMTTAARTAATRASIGRPPSLAPARMNSTAPTVHPVASLIQSGRRSCAGKTGSSACNEAKTAEANDRLPASRSAAMAAR